MISFGGLASGLDTAAIIKALVSVERIPINIMEAQKATANSKLELIGTFKGYVQALQSAADDLKTMGDFLDFRVTASKENVAAFSATGEAAAGSHTLTVLSLAQSDRWAFDGVLDPDTDLASADGEQLDFTVNGTAYSIAVTQASSSLNDIASEINDLAGNDATASVVNIGTSSAPDYQLVLASDSTGEDGRITGISSTIAGLIIDGTGPDGNGDAQSTNNITVGTNAQAIIDGLQVERSTNEFNDVIPGVSIDLQAADPTEEISFTVGADTEAIKTKLQAFVDAYNEITSFINGQNDYTEDDGAGGELFGDSLLRSVRRSINSALFDVDIGTILGDTEGFSTLSLIGIKVSSDGTMSIDDTTLDAKLAEDIDAVGDLFADTDGFDNGGAAEGTPEFYIDLTDDSGLADKLSRAIDRMFGSYTGPNGTFKAIFDSRTETINEKISTLDDQIDSKEVYLARFEQTLIDRYAALESLMAMLNAQGAALTNGLAALTNNSKK
jgi:flagellar hook-associated protein 2